MAKLNRMGILSGVTPHFNISAKKRLTDPFNPTAAEGNSKSIATWIKVDPLLIYREVYEKGRIELASDSHSILMEVLKQQHPQHYQSIQQRKAKHIQERSAEALKRNVKAKYSV